VTAMHLRPRLISIPAEDLVLRKYAERAASSGTSEPEALERLLRPLFPEAVVRPRHELASVAGEIVWYVYRDRLYRRWATEDEGLDRETATAVLDDTGLFNDADAAAADLFGASRAELIGRNGRSFCAPGFEAWYDDVFELLADVGMVATGWQIYRADSTKRYVDLTILRNRAGTRLHWAAFHAVPDLHARAWFGAPSRDDELTQLPSNAR
jgi:PAS domain S-box-containing protein